MLPFKTNNAEDNEACASEKTMLDEAGGETKMPKLRESILDRVAKSDAHFKNQQRGDPELTYTEKIKIATDILDKKPAIFLERFGAHLTESDLVYFDAMKGDYVIDFYIRDIKSKLDDKKNVTKVRNRRFEAMKELTSQGEYFSDEAMKSRDPLLYEQLVGQYLTDDEIQEQVDKADLRLSSILVRHMDITANNLLYDIQKEVEECQMEEEEDDDDEEEEEEDEEDGANDAGVFPEKRPSISDEERQILRQELMRTMELRFLAGEDRTFNYREVDENIEYDSISLREQDEQEKYFDDEESQAAASLASSTSSERSTPAPGSKVTAQNETTAVSVNNMDCDQPVT